MLLVHPLKYYGGLEIATVFTRPFYLARVTPRVKSINIHRFQRRTPHSSFCSLDDRVWADGRMVRGRRFCTVATRAR